MSPRRPACAAARILVRGVNWLGDAVMSMPALQRLREHFPSAEIMVLTEEKLADLWKAQPAVDRILTFTSAESLWTMASRVRAERFDTGLVFPNSPRSAIELWLAGVPNRIGYARAWRNWFLSTAVAPRTGAVRMRKLSAHAISRLLSGPGSGLASAARGSGQTPGESVLKPSNGAVHQSLEYLHLVSALGADPSPVPARLRLAPTEIGAVAAKFGIRSGIGSGLVLGLNPGAQYGPTKRWPVDRFVATAIQIQKSTNCQWLVLGGSADRELAGRITAGIQGSRSKEDEPCLNLAGRTSLRELMAVLANCRLLVTNDSGPMHLAAALGTPVVAIFGSTSPELTGPDFGSDKEHQVLRAGVACSPCFRRECPVDFRCMKRITTDTVVKAVSRAVGLLG